MPDSTARRAPNNTVTTQQCAETAAPPPVRRHLVLVTADRAVDHVEVAPTTTVSDGPRHDRTPGHPRSSTAVQAGQDGDLAADPQSRLSGAERAVVHVLPLVAEGGGGVPAEPQAGDADAGSGTPARRRRRASSGGGT